MHVYYLKPKDNIAQDIIIFFTANPACVGLPCQSPNLDWSRIKTAELSHVRCHVNLTVLRDAVYDSFFK